MKMIVNGKPVEIEPLPGEMLSDLLRERLHLTGTKIGCNESECGACTVLIDGEPVLSCSYPAARAAGKQIITIEGLAKPGSLHPCRKPLSPTGLCNVVFASPGNC